VGEEYKEFKEYKEYKEGSLFKVLLVARHSSYQPRCFRDAGLLVLLVLLELLVLLCLFPQ